MHMFPDKQTAEAKTPMWIPKRLRKGWFLELGPLGGKDIQGEGKGSRKIAHMQAVWKEEASRDVGSWLRRVLSCYWKSSRCSGLMTWAILESPGQRDPQLKNYLTLFHPVRNYVDLMIGVFCIIIMCEHACTHEFTGAYRITKHRNVFSMCFLQDTLDLVKKSKQSLKWASCYTSETSQSPQGTPQPTASLCTFRTLCVLSYSSSSSLRYHHLLK